MELIVALMKFKHIYIAIENETVTGTTMIVKYKLDEDYEYDEKSKTYNRRIVHDGLPAIINYREWLKIVGTFPRAQFE